MLEYVPSIEDILRSRVSQPSYEDILRQRASDEPTNMSDETTNKITLPQILKTLGSISYLTGQTDKIAAELAPYSTKIPLSYLFNQLVPKSAVFPLGKGTSLTVGELPLEGIYGGKGLLFRTPLDFLK